VMGPGVLRVNGSQGQNISIIQHLYQPYNILLEFGRTTTCIGHVLP
jgi:hypothetical protein